jgi:hypothetical protein
VTLLRATPADLRALAGRTSEAIGFPQAFVEKDYWLTEVLRSLVPPITSDDSQPQIILKGGTSLSKAFGLIDRMSEDVDVLLVFDLAISRGRRDRVMKELITRTIDDIGLECKPIRSTTGVKRHVRFLYTQSSKHASVTEGVLLEMGTRGRGGSDASIHELRSYIADYAINQGLVGPNEYADLLPLEVLVLNPVRTLFEKLAALHDAASRLPDQAEEARLARCARHYYDVNRLLVNDSVRRELDGVDAATLASDIDAASEENEFAFTPRPEGGYSQSAAFTWSPTIARVLDTPYSNALDLVRSGQPRPTLQECIVSIRDAERLL